MKIATYLRVSTEEQDLESQRLDLANHCRRNGWSIVAEYSDVISGARQKRLGLGALLLACERKEVDTILVVKLDRLGRSLLNVVNLIADLEKMGVAIICTSQGIDTRSSNPTGKITYQILAAVSEFERNLIRERTIAGLAVARANGKTLGQISKVMPRSKEQRAEIVREWRAKGGKDVRLLGRMLGGVSGSTAWRVAKTVPELTAAKVQAVAQVMNANEMPVENFD